MGTQLAASEFISRATKVPGAAMWTLVALVAGAVLSPTIVIGLFRLAALKRAEDLRAPPQVDEWARSRDLQTPK